MAGRKAGFTHREIRRAFGLGDDSAVNRVCQRTHARPAKAEELRRSLEAFLN